MGVFLSYMMYSGIVLLGLYIVYKWALAPENQNRFNRAVLWGIYILAFSSLPFVKWIYAPAVANIASPSDVIMALPVSYINDRSVVAGFSIFDAILLVYFVGLLLMLLRSILMHIRVLKIISSGEICSSINGFNLVVIDDETIAPFSWMRYIVMSRTDYKLAGDIIAEHEKQHLSQCHWVDLLMAEAVLIVQWFNPASWLLREELRAVHEYQADMGVLRSGINAKEYQLLLISKAVGHKVGSLANSLNHGKMKKRLSMMMSPETNKSGKFKALFILPVAVLFVSAAESLYSQEFFSEIRKTSFENPDKDIDNAIPAESDAISEKIGIDGGANYLDPIVVSAYTKSKFDEINTAKTIHIKGFSQKKSTSEVKGDPTVFIDGVMCTKEQYRSLDPSSIESVTVKKDNPQYPYGIIEIYLKK